MSQDKVPSTKEIDSMLSRLEKRIETLKKEYQRYFLGIDQTPPRVMRKQVVREVYELEQTYISNTAQKFRLRSLVQKFNTNKTRWNRILRQIEEGTYVRDRNRAERRQQRRRDQAKRDNPQQAIELDLEADHIADIEELDLEEVFEPHQPQQPQRVQNSPPAANPMADQDRIKQQRLAEIQKKLGLNPAQNSPSPAPSPPRQTQQPRPSRPSAPSSSQPSQSSSTSRPSSSGTSSRKKKLEAMRRKLNKADRPTPSSSPKPSRSAPGQSTSPQRTRSAPSSGADGDSARKRKLRKLKRNLEKKEGKNKARPRTRQRQPSSSQPSVRRRRNTTGSQRRIVRRSTDDETNE